MNYAVFRLISLFFALSSTSLTAFATSWTPLAKGIEYQDLSYNPLTPWQHTHVFRIDLNKNQFKIITAHQIKALSASAEKLGQHAHALIAFNGGFFDQNYKPLGLRVSNHQQITPVKPISWWGIFSINNNKPHITPFSQYPALKKPDFAIQSGPRLVVNGRIPKLKEGLAQRTALGITHDNKVIVLVTENNPMSTLNLAKLMKSSPLSCNNALNLDGGSSTQLFTQFLRFNFHVFGFSTVSDAVVVLKK